MAYEEVNRATSAGDTTLLETEEGRVEISESGDSIPCSLESSTKSPGIGTNHHSVHFAEDVKSSVLSSPQHVTSVPSFATVDAESAAAICGQSNALPPALEALDTEHSIADCSRVGNDSQDVYDFVVDALRTVIPTELSVHSCAASFQGRYGQNPLLINRCLEVLADFFLTVDNRSRRNTFYVLNDLVQYDSRFRLPALEVVVPRISGTVASMEDRDLYVKTISVWCQRKIYPPDVCRTVELMFQSATIRHNNVLEFEQRLTALAEMARIRSVKDEDLERLLRESSVRFHNFKNVNDVKAATATAIMAASTTELKAMTVSARTALLITQGAIEYISRLLMDFSSQYSSANLGRMEELLPVLDQISQSTQQDTSQRVFVQSTTPTPTTASSFDPSLSLP